MKVDILHSPNRNREEIYDSKEQESLLSSLSSPEETQQSELRVLNTNDDTCQTTSLIWFLELWT